jgi:WhiB family redox-sensing transcriptional regulator
MDWHSLAACKDLEPDTFFPVGNTGESLEYVEYAKKICRRCGVTRDCLNWAITNNIDNGVWGGKDEEERRNMRRSQPGKKNRRPKRR